MITDLLVCPVCHSQLLFETSVICSKCTRTYATSNEGLVLIPRPFPDSALEARSRLWDELQQHGEIAYNVLPATNLSVGDRADVARLMEYMQTQGTLLDIGCGPQARPRYADAVDGRFVGIDPLPGVTPREFDFVQAVGEYLPFRDNTFDAVLSASSLDHVLDPVTVLREIRRVLVPNGRFMIWYYDEPVLSKGERLRSSLRNAARLVFQGDFAAVTERLRRRIQPPSPQPVHPVLDILPTPEGAVDPYHAFRVDRQSLHSWLAEAGLHPVDETTAYTDGEQFLTAVRAK